MKIFRETKAFKVICDSELIFDGSLCLIIRILFFRWHKQQYCGETFDVAIKVWLQDVNGRH